MFETTFDYFYSFSNISETLNDFRIFSWVIMTKSKLTILIIFSNWIYKTLITNKKTKIVTTWHFLYFSFITKRHSDWNALLNSILNKWPSKCISFFRTSKIKVSTCCNKDYFDIIFRKRLNCTRLINIFIVTYS
jgi:hypothetical protein